MAQAFRVPAGWIRFAACDFGKLQFDNG